MPTAILISASSIAADPRVLRQGEALMSAGWTVVSVGYSASTLEREPHWQTRHVPEPLYETAPVTRAIRAARLLGSRVVPSLAFDAWRAQSRHAVLIRAAEGLSGDLVIANDYTSLPLAGEIAARSGASLIYDSHEHAVTERLENLSWRLLYRPYIKIIEGHFAGTAAGVTTVSDGISDALQAQYALREKPAVIRNLPTYRRVGDYPRGEDILVHHHGILVPGRGLELMIASVALWRPHLRLRLRGPIDASYRRSLEALVQSSGVADRVTFADPVRFDDLVESAADADVGLHLLPVIAMPNKVFEYVMAGLMLVTCDLPELSGLVRRYQLGHVLEALTPDALASCVNGLDRAKLASQRERSLAAARELCWDREKERFLALCERCVSSSGARDR
jgi:glycosyltransferase involved in cell wall biosynthesis